MLNKLTNRDGDIVVKGRVGQKAEYNAERDVLNLSFAVTRSWPSREIEGEFDHRTAWYQAAHWGRGAADLAHLDAGDIIEVSFHAADLFADAYLNREGAAAASLKISRCLIRVIEKKEPITAGIPVAQPEPQEVAL